MAAAQVKANQVRWRAALLTDLDDKIQRLNNLLFTGSTRPAGNEIFRFLREQEIRRRYEDRTQSELDLAYMRAIERGDEETVRAFIDVPGGSLVSQDAREQLAQVQGRTNNPQPFQKLTELKEVRGLVAILFEQTDILLPIKTEAIGTE